ncbi:hypothetical protein C9I56_28360 [Paraburkholderia caribensis]|uniref:Uncharacterized protein n=1 Tax=Paraburkholderia caribensis TaxID=75105 RepID=A0A9Q6WMG6_9BURK|nr:hypothetical protein AN416_08145 [Paraburkholderia caribensis]AMV43071.1 hypothetical protein ATN79_10330 [Paraburkholderia caribensis]AUT52200.1 hypothetical protein C2L66_10255 [Paraburkholderia caribensis]PTB25454.1 hypothetical protein C9I56_28360 [Paraburkholderia caribensis]QLB63586.1 hypothetical protein A9O66_15080 [Paraburkholderia caribensis]
MKACGAPDVRRRSGHSPNRCVRIAADAHEGGRHAVRQHHVRRHDDGYDDMERRAAPATAGTHRARTRKD